MTTERGACLSQSRCGKPWQSMVIDLTGEVLPCCYYHFADGYVALGNTNQSTVEEIWNGPGYRDLRRRHLESDLRGHPCGSCMTAKISGHYPTFEWGDGFRAESGYCHMAPIPEQFWIRVRDRAAEVQLFEDGVALERGETLHEEIRRLGGGRYSVWHGVLFMSASDNSNPSRNSKRYELRLGSDQTVIRKQTPGSRTAENAALAFSEYESGAVELKAKPSMLTFIENSDCNIDCPACSQNEVRLNRIAHRPETSRAVLALTPSAQELIWHGGEPYLMPHFREFVRDYRSDFNPDLSFGFMSNGTMIDAAQARHLEQFELFNVTISMDSFVPETYKRMRAGASYERVLENLHRLLALQDFPQRKVVVAMIIGKSNILDLPFNIRYAMRHHIRLMINPILSYPRTEKLNLFTDFAAQTIAWEQALSEAEELLEEAHRKKMRFLEGLDAAKLVRIVRTVFEEQKALHADTVEVRFALNDPHQGLAAMRRPGIVLYPEAGGAGAAIAYAEIPKGAATVSMRAPRSLVNRPMRYSLDADLHEEGSCFRPVDNLIRPVGVRDLGPILREITVPAYVAPPRPKNILYLKRDPAEAIYLKERVSLMGTYEAIQSRERSLGYGFRAREGRFRLWKQPLHAPGSAPTETASEQDPKRSWVRFLVNYFRPFNPDVFAGKDSESDR